MCNRNCGCNRNQGGNPCNPNPQNAEFSRVVATWQTVRHYRIHTRDTLVPVCTRGLANDNFEQFIGTDPNGCGNNR